MSKPQAHCHVLIAETAKKAAGELYEVLMTDNVVYTAWRRQNVGASAKALESRFVARNWPRCIPVARATLAHMLTLPIDETLKESIHEALCLDATLMRGRDQGRELALTPPRMNGDASG